MDMLRESLKVRPTWYKNYEPLMEQDLKSKNAHDYRTLALGHNSNFATLTTN